MAVETPEDLAVFFNPDDFGEAMTAHTVEAGDLPFDGIFTTGYVGEDPGTTATISMKVPRILARADQLVGLRQSDTITRADGTTIIVNDVHYKDRMVIIHIHEVW